MFNIYLDNYLIVPQLDIVERADGPRLPYAEIFEFSYKNDVIRQGKTQEILFIFSSNKRQLQVTFSKIIGNPKVDAIILYQGLFNGKPSVCPPIPLFVTYAALLLAQHAHVSHFRPNRPATVRERSFDVLLKQKSAGTPG